MIGSEAGSAVWLAGCGCETRRLIEEGRRPGVRRLTVAAKPPSDLAAQLVELIAEPVVILAASEDGRATPVITYANPAFARLIGLPADAVVGQSVHVLASAVAAEARPAA